MLEIKNYEEFKLKYCNLKYFPLTVQYFNWMRKKIYKYILENQPCPIPYNYSAAYSAKMEGEHLKFYTFMGRAISSTLIVHAIKSLLEDNLIQRTRSGDFSRLFIYSINGEPENVCFSIQEQYKYEKQIGLRESLLAYIKRHQPCRIPRTFKFLRGKEFKKSFRQEAGINIDNITMRRLLDELSNDGVIYKVAEKNHFVYSIKGY